MSIARLTILSLSACALLACDETGNTSLDAEPNSERRAEQTVVYGDDDRTDYYAVADPALQTLLDQSIVALVRRNDIDLSPFDDVPAGTAIPLGNTLENSRGLCADQRFLDDPTMGNCSGTLIDDDLVLTAGHCVEDIGDCRAHVYVFDYYFEGPGDLQEIDPDDVYECESVAVTINAGNLDYAIVQLDRPVVGRTPAAVNLVDEALPLDTDLTVIGFGSGIPAKVDEGGFVVNSRADTLDYFGATLDTFGGNSGSGVFNEDREVVGILVRGATDYVSRGDCTVVNVLAEDSGTDEDVTYVARAIDELCNDANWPSARLCGGSTTCGDGEINDGEQCDDGNLASGDGCNALCRTEFCGDALVQPDLGEFCDDGNDTPGDGCSSTCVVECGDGDLDGEEQCDDGGLENGDGCSDRCTLELCPLSDAPILVGSTTLGNTCEGADVDASASCGRDNSGGDDAYLFIAPRDGVYLFDTLSDGTNFDTVLYARTECGGAELACDDDSDLPGADEESSFSLTLEDGDEIVVFVSGFRDECGEYGLNISVAPCGDGVVADGEQCDDGNLDDGDGCSSACQSEELGSCVTEETALVLNAPVIGDTCEGQNAHSGATCGADNGTSLERSFTFVAPQAGTYRFDTVSDTTEFDTVVYALSDCEGEQLGCNDDVVSGDTRSRLVLEMEDNESAVILVHGYSGSCGVFELLATTDECGNARIDADEDCDDGNTLDGDGCSAACDFEDGPRCGDGVVDEGEACDDGNDVALDGCSPLCLVDGCALSATLDFETGAISGNSCGLGFADAANCGEGESGSAFPVAFVAPLTGTYTFSTDSEDRSFDTVLTTSDSCGGEQLDCNDDTVGRASEIQATLADGESIFLAVSGFEGACGLFELSVTINIVEPECGNAILEDGEECDNGDANSNTDAGACRTNCTLAFCGDGILDDDEACDDGANNADLTPGACRTDCSAPFCGDGVQDPDEACDEGPANGDEADACRLGCVLPQCGDSIVDTGEMCDAGDANGDTPNGCRSTCMLAGCGDGVVDMGEACDEGVFNSDEVADACRTSCTLPLCGDGVVDADEECDDGEDNDDESADTCRVDCVLPFCGDAVVDLGESCDEGDANSDDPSATCSSECAAPTCGDGIINGEEECDEGAENADESDACRTMCALPFCGDAIVDSDEECDAGVNNANERDACRLDCRVPFCGDGIVDGAEECDDGSENMDEPGGCGLDCSIVPFGHDVDEDAGSDAGGDAEADIGADSGTDAVDNDTVTPDATGDVGTDTEADSDTPPDDVENDSANPDIGGQDTTGQDAVEDTANQDTMSDTAGEDTTTEDGGEDSQSDASAPDVGGETDSTGVDVGSAGPDSGAETVDEGGNGDSESGCSAAGGALPSLWFVLLTLGALVRRGRQVVV